MFKPGKFLEVKVIWVKKGCSYLLYKYIAPGICWTIDWMNLHTHTHIWWMNRWIYTNVHVYIHGQSL